MQTIEKTALKTELEQSAIAPAIAKLNFVWVKESFDPDEMMEPELLLYALSDDERRNDGRLRDFWVKAYGSLGGGWWCGTLEPDGSPSPWGCLKAQSPRTGKDGKIIKYETPPKTPTKPFFLKIDRHHWEKIAVNNGLTAPDLEGLPDESIHHEFWSWAQSKPELPIVITEGAKKTASLLSAGFCAVGLSGIWNGIRNPVDQVMDRKSGDHVLVPELLAIAQKGRKFVFCFDQDEKPKTVAAVKRAMSKTAELLAQETGLKSYGLMQWDYPELKGIDDVHAAKGEAELWRIYDERKNKRIIISNSEEKRAKEKLEIAKALLEENGDRLDLPSEIDEATVVEVMGQEMKSMAKHLVKAYNDAHKKETLKQAEAVFAKIEALTSTPLAPVREYDPKEKSAPVANTTKPLANTQPEHRRIYGGTKNLNYAELFEFIREEIAHRLTFDLMRREMLLDGEIFLLADELRAWFFHEYGETANEGDIYKAMVFFAKQNKFDPVVEDLKRCQREAQRVPIHNLATRYFGQDPDQYPDESDKRKAEIYNRCIEMWLISAVARQFDTQGKDGIRTYLGCQADHTLILQGGQGKGKSTWFKHLTKIYFNDSITEIQSTNSLMALHGNWILELAEIDGITSKKDAATLKHYLTVRQDEFRAPYERKTIKHNRRSVFCGTVNPSRFLLDDENRRFWTIPVKGDIDLNLIQQERDGIWASAVDAYLAGNPWYPNDAEKEIIKAIALEFSEIDVWHEEVESWMQWHSYGNTNEILIDVFHFDLKEIGKREQMRISKILNKLGYTEDRRIRKEGRCLRVKVKPDSKNAPSPSNTPIFNGSSGSSGSTPTQQDSEMIQPLIQPPNEVDQYTNGQKPKSDPAERSMIQPNLPEVGSPSSPVSGGDSDGVIQRSNQNQLFEKSTAGFSVGDFVIDKRTGEELEIIGLPTLGASMVNQSHTCRRAGVWWAVGSMARQGSKEPLEVGCIGRNLETDELVTILQFSPDGVFAWCDRNDIDIPAKHLHLKEID